MDLSRFNGDGLGSRANMAVKSIQIVDLDGSASYTINTIVPGNTILFMLGFRASEAAVGPPSITNSTTIAADTSIQDGQLLVLEFDANAVKSKQTGSVTVPANGSIAETINSVNTSKCLVNCFFQRYYIHEDTNPDLYNLCVTYAFQSSTSILFTQTDAGLNYDAPISYEILELV